MARRKKKSAKRKPEIIARFLKIARTRAEQKGLDIDVICRHFSCSPATIYNYEDERRTLTYDQLHRYVEFYGLPAGVMLIITRLTSELRDGHVDRAESISRGLEAIAAHILANRAELSLRDYQADRGAEQDRTLAELWDVYQSRGLYEPVAISPRDS